MNQRFGGGFRGGPGGNRGAGGRPGGPGGGPWRNAYATRDLTTGSIPRNLWFLAWPQYMEASLRIVDQMADLVWAGIFGGFKSIAGMGAAQQYLMMGFTARMGIDMAMRAMVSRAIGMGDTALANHVVLQASSLTLAFSLLLIIIGAVFTETLLRMLGLSEDVVAQAAPYMRVQLFGQAAIGFQNLTGHALAAAGDTLTPMKAGVIVRVIHLPLSPLLVFGLFGFPALGLPGAAAATIVSHAVSLTYLLSVLFRGTSRLHLRLAGYRPDPVVLKQLIKIGWPASVNGMERTIAQLSFGFLVAPFGDLAYAAFTVTRRVEMLAHTGGMGIGMAAGTIAGQSIGAGKPDRAKKTVLWACLFGLVINGVLSILMLLFPDLFLSLFAREPEFLDAARGWLYIMLVGYAALGSTMAMAQAFQMAGDTMIVMLVNLVSLWASVPIGLVLSRATPLGELGVAWAMVIPMVIRPFVFVPYFYWGRWMRVRLFANEPVARVDDEVDEDEEPSFTPEQPAPPPVPTALSPDAQAVPTRLGDTPASKRS